MQSKNSEYGLPYLVVCHVTICYLRVQRNLNIEKTFKVVQMKFIAMHITNQKNLF